MNKRKAAVGGAAVLALVTVSLLTMVGDLVPLIQSRTGHRTSGRGWVVEDANYRLFYEDKDAVSTYEFRVEAGPGATQRMIIGAGSSLTVPAPSFSTELRLSVRDTMLGSGGWSGVASVELPMCGGGSSCRVFWREPGGSGPHYLMKMEPASAAGWDWNVLAPNDTIAFALGPDETWTLTWRAYDDSLGVWRAPSPPMILQTRVCNPAPPDTTAPGLIERVWFKSGWIMGYTFNDTVATLQPNEVQLFRDGVEWPANNTLNRVDFFEWWQYVGDGAQQPGQWLAVVKGDSFSWIEP